MSPEAGNPAGDLLPRAGDQPRRRTPGSPPTRAPAFRLPATGYPQFPPPRPAKPGVVELRPLSLSDLLDGTFAVLRRAPMPTLVNAAVVQLVLGILGLVVPGLAACTHHGP